MAPAEAADAGGIGRADIESFLTRCIETFASDATRKSLKQCTSVRPGVRLLEIQRKIWSELGIEEDAGRRAIARLGSPATSEDPEVQRLLRLRTEFGQAADKAVLRSLEDRRPDVLEKKAKMSRAAVLEFLDAGRLLMDDPEVQQRLRACIEETGAMPERVVTEIHGETMSLVGFDPEHGLRCLQSLGTDQQFKSDREVAMAVARWRGKTSEVCIELLSEFRKGGGELHVDEEVLAKLYERQAQKNLDAMTFEERSALLEKNAKKVNIVRNLPPDGRKRYVDKLSEQEKIELAQTEILMATLVQAREQQLAQQAE
eukprot:TRINITY_DN14737_c0_g1_i1.p1 TRINITY_DN14737_c0_g1~~TRINITY_DN14737_c0_g1_i1.p1  ORF type:complete len:322 (+),score=99.63 TRINITY_DN14737_c0_g1_i1:24-968(+)